MRQHGVKPPAWDTRACQETRWPRTRNHIPSALGALSRSPEERCCQLHLPGRHRRATGRLAREAALHVPYSRRSSARVPQDHHRGCGGNIRQARHHDSCRLPHWMARKQTRRKSQHACRIPTFTQTSNRSPRKSSPATTADLRHRCTGHIAAQWNTGSSARQTRPAGHRGISVIARASGRGSVRRDPHGVRKTWHSSSRPIGDLRRRIAAKSRPLHCRARN